MENNLEITKKPGNKKVTIINIILIIAIFIGLTIYMINVDGIENIENVDIEDSSYIILNEKQLIAFEIGGGLE